MLAIGHLVHVYTLAVNTPHTKRSSCILCTCTDTTGNTCCPDNELLYLCVWYVKINFDLTSVLTVMRFECCGICTNSSDLFHEKNPAQILLERKTILPRNVVLNPSDASFVNVGLHTSGRVPQCPTAPLGALLSAPLLRKLTVLNPLLSRHQST